MFNTNDLVAKRKQMTKRGVKCKY